MVSSQPQNSIEMSHYSHHLDTKVCDGAVTLASNWIGEAKDVEIKSQFSAQISLVCGAPCRLSHVFLLDSRNLFLFQVPQPVSRQQEAAPTQMIVTSLTLFASTMKTLYVSAHLNMLFIFIYFANMGEIMIQVPLFILIMEPTSWWSTRAARLSSTTKQYLHCWLTVETIRYVAPSDYYATSLLVITVDAFWANLVDLIAPKCQAKQNAHGGLCVANDKSGSFSKSFPRWRSII